MQLSPDQVLALAPDASSANAGKKLASFKAWKHVGRNDDALWGECQGSALYQVRVALGDMSARCSCPSRKFPCKHSLGLMLLLAGSPAEIPRTAPPSWVTDWLSKLEATRTKREEQAAEAPASKTPADPERARKAASRTASKRAALVAKGMDALDLWMSDLVRGGIAGIELKPASFWEAQAARMVDAQAPGIAARLRSLATIPNSGPDWPDRLLHELGRIALLTHGYRRIGPLPAPLQADVRMLVGWTLKEDEVIARGEHVRDRWIVLGERVTVEGRLRASATWLAGATTRRWALVLQYAHGGAKWDTVFVPGSVQDATMVYWPSAYPQRALIHERHGSVDRFNGALPGEESIDGFLETVARALGQQPWLDTFPCLLNDIVVACAGDRWLAQDEHGRALPLAPGDHWALLALGGGAPVDLMGLWNGRFLVPMGAMADGRYHILPEPEA